MATRNTQANPPFETTSVVSDAATKRVAAMRESDAKAGTDTSGLSDLDYAFSVLDTVEADRRGVQNLYSRMMQEQNVHERNVRIGATRAAEENRMAWAQHLMDSRISKAMYDLNVLLHTADSLADRPKPSDVAKLKTAARNARQMLQEHPRDESMKVAEHWRAEAWRLRDFVMASGRALHAEFGAESGGCFCRGCELIRGMDDIETPDEQAGA